MIRVISEVGSINKAADLLNISQPTLSKKVSRLEHKIQMELFSRDNAGMAPTEAAKFLLREGDELRTQLSIIERKLELMASQVGGIVKIGVGPIIEQIILPKVLLDFSEQDYQFKISVVTLSQRALLDQLKRGEIDLAIGPFADDEVPDEFSAPLSISDKIVGAVRVGHELASRDTIQLDEMTRFKSVSPNIPKSLGHQVMALIKGFKLEPNIICENYSMAKSIVANSDYITAGPESLFRTEFARGELAKLSFQAEVFWHCKCLVKPEILLSPIVKEVVSIFAQYMSVYKKQ